MSTTPEVKPSAFATEILKGLSQHPKRLYSKFFYDNKGDKLFQEIMKMEEYYLTKSEFEIFSTQKDKILEAFGQNNESIQLIEFGAGDGLKTKILLEHLLEKKVDFEYLPIDISASVLKELNDDLSQRFPTLQVKPIVNDYFSALKNLRSDKRKVVLFLGSNIGNFVKSEALKFLGTANENLNEGDFFFIGVDLKKDPQIILDAYHDKGGITKAFNLNLLSRINYELDADFDLSQFKHFPVYNPETGETKSYLVSLKDQTVNLNSIGKEIHFNYAESIFMEISKKYGIEELEELAAETNFGIVEHFYDCKHYFVNTLWKKINT